jgi:hypothetical protein
VSWAIRNNYDQSSEKEKQYESSKQIDKSLLVANATALAVTIASLSTIFSGGTNSRMDKDNVYDAAMVVILFTFGVLSGMASTIFILMIEQMSEKLKKELSRLKEG